MRITRSRADKILFGVCGGLADYFGWDASVTRLVFIVATVLGFGSFAVLYLILALVLPEEF